MFHPCFIRGSFPSSFRANLHIALGNYHQAIKDCDQCVRLGPRQYTGYINRGVAHDRLGQLDLAVADYGKAIEVARQVGTPYRNRGIIFVQQGKLDAAIDDFTQAIRIDPTDVIAYDNRGTVHLQQGDAGKAIADFSRLIQLVGRSRRRSEGGYQAGKKTAQVHAKRAEAYRLGGDYQRAASDCQQALEIDPNCRVAMAVRASLAQSNQPAPAPEDSP